MDRPDIRCINLNRHRLADQVDLQDESKLAPFLDKDSRDAFQRSRNDLNALTNLEIWVEVHRDAGFEKPAYSVDLFVGDRFGPPFDADESHRPRYIQDAVAVFGSIDMIYEDVPGEKREPNPFPAVFPTAEYFPHREKDLNRAVSQIEQQLFFKPAAGIQRIPGRIIKRIHGRRATPLYTEWLLVSAQI